MSHSKEGYESVRRKIFCSVYLMLAVIQVVVNNMFNSVRTGRNRRYPDFLSQRQNQCWAAILIVLIIVLASLGFAHLITNGIANKTTYSG